MLRKSRRLERGRPRRRSSGTKLTRTTLDGIADHPARHRRPPRRTSRPAAVRPGPAPGTSGRTSRPATRGPPTRPPSSTWTAASPRCGSRRRPAPTSPRCSTVSCSTWRRWSSTRPPPPSPSPRGSSRTPTVASSRPAPTSGSSGEAAGEDLVAVAELARQGRHPRRGRRRDRGARPRRLRRPGARPLAGRRRAGAAHAHRGRHPGRRGRRLVEFRYAATDEQFPTIAKLRAARRLWARVLELSGCRETREPAPARGHQPADDEQVRPLGQHAPHHRRGLRGRRRRGGRGDGAAVRQPARAPGRLRPPDRPQHLRPADLRVARRPGRRPGRRRLRRREADRRPRPRRLGGLRPDRGR